VPLPLKHLGQAGTMMDPLIVIGVGVGAAVVTDSQRSRTHSGERGPGRPVVR
jgi:hypothetical protein